MIQCTLFVLKLLKFKQRVCKMCTFKTEDFKLYKLTTGPEINVELTKVEAIKIYTQMQSIRRLETIIGNFYQAKKIRGFCHLCNGQEACAVGIYQAMRPEDKIISSYRVHGLCYLMANNNAHLIFSELLAKKAGISRGRGGSMHLFAKSFYGGHGIVGAQVPLGAGVALAIKYLDTKGVCFSLYGDGASNQGQVFEAFNMAKILKLPCVFVCENNLYGMGTSAERSSANLDYYTRGDYIPGILVDAMDVLAVKQASKFAIDYCLDKGGPILLELKTYRYFGHSMSDPGTTYRTREEIQQVRQTRDPLKIFSTKIIEKGLATEDEISKIDADIKKQMGADSKKAEKDVFPPLEDLTADIYKIGYEQSVRGITNFTNWKHFNIPNKAK